MEIEKMETPIKKYIKRNRIDSDDDDEGQNYVEECSPTKRPSKSPKKEKKSDDESDSENEEYFTGNEEDGYSQSSEESEDEIDENDHYLDKIDDFTEEQKDAFDYVIKLITDKMFRRENPTAIFIDGHVGAGKTELLTTLCEYTYKKLDKPIIFVASTGSAAQKYHKGRTSYSVFGFPWDEEKFTDDFCDMSDYNKQVSGAEIIVFDEVQMTNRLLLEMLDRTLRNVMMSEKLFGGKIIVFAGDFRQVAPVVKAKNVKACRRGIINAASPKTSELWPELKKFSLTISQRTKSDPDFTQYLSELGNDMLQPQNIPGIDAEFVPLNNIEHTFKLDDIIDFVYPKYLINDADQCARRSIIAPHNKTVNKINSKLLDRLKGKMKICEAEQDIRKQSKTEELLLDRNMLLEDKNFPDFTLKLKKGCLCTIIRTMYKPTTLLVGTRVVVTKILPKAIIIRKVGEKQCYSLGMKCFERYDKKTRVKEIIYQFPVKLGYATTIHTSQGMTFDRVGVDLRELAFTHGQLYTALGRVRSKKDVKVLIKEEHVINNIGYTASVNHFELME